MKRKIIVLGPNGMLGQMVAKYFSARGFDVIPFGDRFSKESHVDFIRKINEYDNGIVVNCIGRIKQKTEDISELLWVNAVLPIELSRLLKSGHTLIHASTDCVFNGDYGAPYSVDHTVDATDSYGWSKILGEFILLKRKNTIICRVSIIGPDSNTAKGLLSWFLNQPAGSVLKGFTNHFWNGITTLEWCRQVEGLLEEFDENQSLLRQIGTKEDYNKFQMLQLFQEIFETRFDIITYETETSVDRRLVPEIVTKPLKEQLQELKEFMFAF